MAMTEERPLQELIQEVLDSEVGHKKLPFIMYSIEDALKKFHYPWVGPHSGQEWCKACGVGVKYPCPTLLAVTYQADDEIGTP